MDFSTDPETEYAERTFKKLTLQAKQISKKKFENCTFVGCSFQECGFLNCQFRDCIFQECDLRMLKVRGSSFRNTIFKKSQVIGVNWVEGSWSKKGLLDSIGFIESDVSYCTFIGLELSKMAMTHCTAKNADFAEANLTEADFSQTDFSEARFLHTNLTEANFTHATHYAIDMTLNTLKKAKFSLPEAVNLLRCMNIVLVE
jgi:uncharacterized protein YjbI with pentapeptide repeats